jgi:hypothetical protein
LTGYPGDIKTGFHSDKAKKTAWQPDFKVPPANIEVGHVFETAKSNLRLPCKLQVGFCP